MSAHTLVTSKVIGGGCGPGSAGAATMATGTFTGSASYDAAGSVLDMSSIFKSTVVYFKATADDAGLSCKWVPAASNAAATMKVFVDDDAGTEKSGNLSGTTFEFFAIGTDG